MKLTKRASFVISTRGPFNFKLTVRKPAGWPLFNSDEVLQGETLWTATRMQGMVVGLKMSYRAPKIRVSVYAAGELSRGAAHGLASKLARLMGVDDGIDGFYSMARGDPILKHAVADLYGMRDTQTAYIFNSVVLSICLQMARLDRSMKMLAAIRRRHGTRVEFDGKSLLVEPSAEALAKLDPRRFAEECRLGYRAKFIVGAAKMVAKGFPGTLELLDMGPERAKEKLMELPGVGDYAADIINPAGGFPIDAWSVDVFGKLFFGKEPEDGRDAIERVKQEGIRRWGPCAWLAFFYVAQDLKGLSERLGVQLRLE